MYRRNWGVDSVVTPFELSNEEARIAHAQVLETARAQFQIPDDPDTLRDEEQMIQAMEENDRLRSSVEIQLLEEETRPWLYPRIVRELPQAIDELTAQGEYLLALETHLSHRPELTEVAEAAETEVNLISAMIDHYKSVMQNAEDWIETTGHNPEKSRTVPVRAFHFPN
jgi:hypothetical protein